MAMHHHTTPLLLLLVVVAATTTLTGHGHGVAQLQGTVVGCMAHERDALLEFKRGITSDPTGLLASWKPGERRQDCCRWRGVRCNNSTGHVVGLHLRNVLADNESYIGESDDTALAGQISPSLLSLPHLMHLDLSLNNLQGPTGRLPEFLGSLKNLRYLNLSNIPFQGRVPPQLGNLSRLHQLDLSSITYTGAQLYSADISWLTRPPSLQYLSMNSINLTMALDWPHSVSMIPALRVLDLSSCGLTSANQSLPHLNLTQIVRLDLSGNDFQHPVASCWFWNLTSLTYLVLGGTHLYGQFHHHALSGMTALQVLDLLGSDGTGNPYITDGGLDIMTANMRNLCSLENLILSGSDMNGDIAELFDKLPKCSAKLKELHLGNNDFTGVIPNWIFGQWASLLVLDLSNNRITGHVPSQIGILNSLLTLDLSNNQMSGPVPSEIRMLNNLTGLYLGGNYLTGVITHEFLAGLTRLTEIDLSTNSLKIAVDPDWLPPFSLQYAHFASCEMGPQFPTWLQSQVEISELDLSYTAIFDCLPVWFATTFSNAWKVNISHNGLNGTLPTNTEAMTSLERLHLNSNQLTGQLPRFPEGLHILDISRNHLSGPLPSDFGAPYIEDLRLFSNRITGHVPKSMCQLQFLMGILDLSNNLLEGEFPECFHPQQFSMLFLSNNNFSGRFPPSLQRCTDLYVLDLESNNFNGELPMWIGDMVNLEIVRLGHNNFSGSIPATITNLTKLVHLDLAANSISGVLPRNLSNLRGMTAWGSPTTLGNYVPILNLSVITKGDERYYEESQIFNMVIIDLSSNFLTGEIPEEITSLDSI